MAKCKIDSSVQGRLPPGGWKIGEVGQRRLCFRKGEMKRPEVLELVEEDESDKADICMGRLRRDHRAAGRVVLGENIYLIR